MTSFKLFAGTDVGLRDNNEDNFIVIPDLTQNEWMVPASQQEAIPLGKWGCLMVVADGMGGMNAGEIASAIAIKTVQELFSPSKIPADVVEKPESIKAYLRKVIIQADQQIKQRCKDDPSTEGMGSTIILAWLFGDTVYIGWLGDSRAYSYIPEQGISRLSKDHSYVQELVDSKILTEEEAMVHPESNVIIRSLGDVTQKAKPDVISHPIEENEIILLCSDGLCGVCTDDTIADIISQTSGDLRNCKETLTNAALEAGGSDNITIALLQIVSTEGNWQNSDESHHAIFWRLSWQNLLVILIPFTFIASLGFIGLKPCRHSPSQEKVLSDSIASTDSVKSDSCDKMNDSNNTDSNSVSKFPPMKLVLNKGISETTNDTTLNDNKSEVESSTPTPSKGESTGSPKALKNNN